MLRTNRDPARPPLAFDPSVHPGAAWLGAVVAPCGTHWRCGFFAGPALAALHPHAGDDHPLGRLWHQRLALRSTAALIRLSGRGEDEAGLRDAWYLTRPGDDPGPAGRLLGAFRMLGEARALRSDEWPARLPALFGIKVDDAGRAALAYAAAAGREGNAARIAASRRTPSRCRRPRA